MKRQSFPIWMDGELRSGNEAFVHILSPSLHYGWGVYEGIRFYSTQDGPAAFRLTDHLKRLYHSARGLSMVIPFSLQELIEACHSVVRASELTSGYIRPLVYLAEGEMSISTQINDVKVAIACWQWSSYAGDANEGIKVRTSSWTRNPDQSLPPALKTTGGYINASLARLEATKSGCHEAIMLNIYGRVAEGTASNLFIVADGQLITPPLSEGILPGITRDAVIAIAHQLQLPVIEQAIAPIDLQIASEVFLAGTALELKSVTYLNGTQLNSERPFFKQLNAKFQLAIHGKLETKAHWSELIHQSL